MSYYEKKYLKYKSKYFELKKNIKQDGGDKPYIKNIDKINLFDTTKPDHIDMEPFLNPIYGLIMCENGYIKNNYYLYQANFLTDERAKKIENISKVIPGTIQPTNDIMKNTKPIDIGRYIALLYICSKNRKFIQINQDKFNIMGILKKQTKANKAQCTNDIIALSDYIDKDKIIKRNFPMNSTTEEIDFHIILYCLWWVANNDMGIQQYYNGINEVFNICNKYLDVPLRLIDLEYKNVESNSFEQITFDVTYKDFIIYNQEQAQHFCPNANPKNKTYPDCVEVTMRNLINLVCFNEGKSDVEKLEAFGAIPQLVEYYKVFNDFNKQSDTNPYKISFNGDVNDTLNLNARDAWSYLIIKYANKNIRFLRQCDGMSSSHEMNSGMSIDGMETNFFQLIKNLLPKVEKWENFENEKITNINNNIDKKSGLGTVEMKYMESNVTIHCDLGHYYMEMIKEEKFYDYTKLSEKQQHIISILLQKDEIKNMDNYLLIKWSSESLVEKISNNLVDVELRKKLLELSLTNQYDSDTRRRIKMDVDDEELFTYFIDKSNNNMKMNEYTFKSNDFSFVRKLPLLTHINSVIKNKNITNIDLLPLSNITSIGDGFIFYCKKLESIDLSPLSKVTLIGDGFMIYCSRLTSIDLSPLSNITSISNAFMSSCWGLTRIDLSPLSNITHIGERFMSDCANLTSINLSELLNLTSLGNGFMIGCSNLESINLSGLSNLTSIGHIFMNNCSELTSIDLSGLSKVTSIGDNFMNNCKKLTSIDLSGLSKVTSIGKNFMNNCTRLTSINLSGLSKVTSIGYSFMNNCSELTSIDLSGLSNLKSIDICFLNDCSKLTSINLSGLSKVTSIDNNFMNKCLILTSINLSGLSGLTSIDYGFMNNCSELTSIDLSGLSNLKSIGNIFMENCRSLTSINLSGLSKVTSIGNNFMNDCSSLQSINLSELLNVSSINYDFMKKCSSLTSINLPPNIKSIDNKFMKKCSSIQSIDLSGLSMLTSIGSYFMDRCTYLTNINLSGLSMLTSIGNNFMDDCMELTNINLSGLSNLKSIGDYFMRSCMNLTNINLSELLSLTSISDNFMTYCSSLTSIDLPPNITSIGKYFMNDCSGLQSIDLSKLSKLHWIGNDFMKNYHPSLAIYTTPELEPIINSVIVDNSSKTFPNDDRNDYHNDDRNDYWDDRNDYWNDNRDNY